MVQPTAAPGLAKRVVFNTQKRGSLFVVDETGHLRNGDDIAVASNSTDGRAQVQFVHQDALLDHTPLVCGADGDDLQCSVNKTPKKLLVCVPEDGKYGFYAADLGYASADCQEGGFRLDVLW